MSPLDRPRERALVILRKTEEGIFADALLEDARSSFAHRDSAFILELVYGALRNRALLDSILDRFSEKPVRRTDAWTRNILRLGAYQLLFLDRVPASAAVNTSVDLAGRHGRKQGYVNGLLRSLERKKSVLPPPSADDPVKRFSLLYSHPEWLVRRWIAKYGFEAVEPVLASNNQPAPLCIRTNMLMTTREELRALFEADGSVAQESGYSPAGIEIVSSSGIRSLAAYRSGLFIVQDEAAQLVGLMLDPRPGEAVLDACAAPGGKTTHLAELMGNTGTVIALESDPKRIGRIVENSKRLGITIIRPVRGDAAKYRGGPYDKILIDAPCSGLGVLRRHPDGRWTKNEGIIREKQALQKRILENCSRLLRPGGALVYATCTTEPEENEEVIREFLAGHPDFALDDPRPFLPAAAAGLVDGRGFFRTFPARPEMDGFFGARMVKKS